MILLSSSVGSDRGLQSATRLGLVTVLAYLLHAVDVREALMQTAASLHGKRGADPAISARRRSSFFVELAYSLSRSLPNLQSRLIRLQPRFGAYHVAHD